MKNRCLLIILFISFRSIVSFAQADGTYDYTLQIGSGFAFDARTVVMDNNQKILVGGNFPEYNTHDRNKIVRINQDGTVDTGFNPGTGANHNILAIAVQTDGKILVGGVFTTFNNVFKSRLVRLNENGSIDSSFDVGSGFDNIIQDIKIQDDGKIIVVGDFSNYNGVSKNRILRLNPNGSVDDSFVGTGSNDHPIKVVEIQDNGKILIGGGFTGYNGSVSQSLARLNNDGSLDTTFDMGEGVDGIVFDIAIQSDKKILIAGFIGAYDGNLSSGIARIEDNGAFDFSFDVQNGVYGGVETVKVQTDDKILIGGDFDRYGGQFSYVDNFIRINTDGSLDTTFNLVGSANNRVFGMAIQEDDKIIIVGRFISYNGVNSRRIARINATSTLGMDDISTHTDFLIYPNPVKDTFSIVSTDNTIKNIKVFDFSGKLILETNTFNSIDLQSHSSGIYFVEINSVDNYTTTRKLIKL